MLINPNLSFPFYTKAIYTKHCIIGASFPCTIITDIFFLLVPAVAIILISMTEGNKISPLYVIINIATGIATISVFLKTSLTDPGVLPKQKKTDERGIDESLQNPSSQSLQIQKYFETSECQTCNIQKPFGTAHCSECGHCVVMLDHHCPWTGTCIGIRNYRYFVISCGMIALHCGGVMALSIAGVV